MTNRRVTDWTIWLRQQRNRAVRILLGLVLLTGLAGILTSFWNWAASGFGPVANLPVYIVAYSVVVLLTILPAVRDEWRAYGFLVILYGFGAYSLYSGWLVSGGRLFLLALTVVAAILATPRAGITAAIASLITYVAFALAFNQQWLVLRALPNPITLSPILIEGVGFVMTLLMAVTSQWFFAKALQAANAANREAMHARALLTDRAQELETANHLLSTSIASFHNIVERSVDGVLVVDQQDVVCFANQAAAMFFGLSPERLVGSSAPFSVMAAQDTALEIPGTAASSQVAEVRVVETEWDGQPAYLALLRDITERRQIEEALHASQQTERDFQERLKNLHQLGTELSDTKNLDELYRCAVEWGCERLGFDRLGLWLVDEHGDMLMGTYGIDKEGRVIDEYAARKNIADHPLERIRDVLQHRSLADVYFGTHEHWHVLASLWDGDRNIGLLSADNQIHGAPLVPYQTELLSLYGTTVGYLITRKQAEVLRESLIEELETKNAQLERFVYTVSHDLKSPVITIKGFLGYLAQDAANADFDRMHSDIEHIATATDKMKLLLDDLLELSRIGRLMNPPAQISVTELVYEAVDTVAGTLNARNVRVEIAPDMPVVVGDRVRIREIWENLLSNAAKFMGEQRHPCIEVGVRDQDGETVYFVRDNGIGIDPRYCTRIFNLFEKLDPDSDGTGIGLAIVKRIVEIHGGRIWAESEGSGCGSTFYFTLPSIAPQSALSGTAGS